LPPRLRIRGWLHFYFHREGEGQRLEMTEFNHEPFGTIDYTKGS